MATRQRTRVMTTTRIPPPRTDGVRCGQCNKKVAERLAGELHVVCPRCNTQQIIRMTDGQAAPHHEVKTNAKQ